MLTDACANFGFLSTGTHCINENSRRVLLRLPAGTVSDYGDIVGEGGLICADCVEEYQPAKCEDFGENEEPYCPDGYISYPSVHDYGEISLNQKKCMSRIVCFTCNNPYVPPPY